MKAMKLKIITFLLSALITLAILTACDKPPEPAKFTTVMECINDAKLNDRDMKLVGEQAKVLGVDEFIEWYNTEYVKEQ